jgi:NADPH:quinone reductase-like Zn-dependent oxidoreductase
MKAVRLQVYGEVDNFKVEDVPVPVPQPGEILVKVAVSAVNHIDHYIRLGYVAQLFPLDLPATLGVAAAGTIEAIGPGVAGFAIGERVIAHLGINGRGAHAEFAIAPVAGVAKLPAAVSFERGVTLPLTGHAGRQGVDALGLKGGEAVLVGGALSAVGRTAIQYIKELGAVPVAAVRPGDLAEGRLLAGEALDITQTPADARFLYAIAPSQATVANVIKHVRDGGRVSTFGPPPEDANPNVTLLPTRAHDDPAILQKLVDAVARGELVIPIAEIFDLDRLDDAFAALAAGSHGLDAGSLGKIVVQH